MPTTQTFSSPGEYQWTVPDNARNVVIKMWGPGGGGGGGATTTAGGAGGTGGYIELDYDASSGETLTVWVGGSGSNGDASDTGGGTGQGGAGGTGYRDGGAGGNGQNGGDGGGGGGGGGASATLSGGGSVIGSSGGGGGGSGATDGGNQLGGGGGGGARGGVGGTGNQAGADGGGTGAGGDGGDAPGTDGNGNPGFDGGTVNNLGTVITSTTGGGNSGDGRVEITYDVYTTVSGTSNITSSAETVATAGTGPRGTTNITSSTGTILSTTPKEITRTIWRISKDGGTTYEPDLFDVEITDTANPFGNYAVAYLDDTEGDKFDKYPRGTRVDFEVSYNAGTTFFERFAGFVVERRETDENGADTLEVECYSFDQLLRRGTVSRDTSGQSIAAALKQIIQEDTALTWNADLVNVVDDQQLTRNFRGEKVENAIQSLAQKSANEQFGVSSEVEFYFRIEEFAPAPRDIDNSQWLHYDIPERGKRSINEVTVWFAGGEESVTIADGGDKQELQDSIGTADPITFSQEVTREDITDIDNARDVAESILNKKAPLLTGTVTTYGLLSTAPGDVVNIEIVPRGINEEFRIAEVKYKWGTDETILTIVEKRGNNDDWKKAVTDDLSRVEMRPANRDAINNRVTNTNVAAVISTSGTVESAGFERVTLTNTARNKLRDAWGGEAPLSIAEIAVGNGDKPPNRTQNSLENELARDTVTEALPDSKTVEYTASVSADGPVEEVGLFDADGNLIMRAVTGTPVYDETSGGSEPLGSAQFGESLLGTASPPNVFDVTITLPVSDDATINRGVLTNVGQTSVRDILADNAPTLPTQYAYGDDGSPVSETDTSLRQIVSQDLENYLVQYVSSQTHWSGATSTQSHDPVTVSNGELTNQQCNFVFEGEDFSAGPSVVLDTNSSYSGGEAAQIGTGTNASADYVEWEFTPQYDLPAAYVDVAIRIAGASTQTDFRVKLDNDYIESASVTKNSTPSWFTGLASGSAFTSITGDASDRDSYDGDNLTAGEPHILRIEMANAAELNIDVVSIYDNRYTYTFDDTTDANGYLSGPELYPDLIDAEFDSVTTRRDVTSATVEQTWNDTSNNQYVRISADGGGTWTRADNSSSVTATFATATTNLVVSVGLSRWGSQSSATPTTGISAQSIDLHELFADVDAIAPESIGIADVQAILAPGQITGQTIREGGQLASDGTLLTHTLTDETTVESNQRIIGSERISFKPPE